MVAPTTSSGDAAADRRAAYAETLALHGDLAAATEILAGALDLVPGWSAGWVRLGELEQAAGRIAEAEAAWDRALALDPRDPFGAALMRDLARGRPVSETMPPAFVETLFDAYAPRFETALVDRLGYRGPEALMQALDEAGLTRAERALDLGCGTGLMGAALRPRCDWLGGIDISGGMLAEARAKRIYDRLDKADIGTLELGADRYDLIVAADVFIYVGALERVIAWCLGALRPGGRLAFTVERGEAGVTLRDSRRFAHSRAYVAGLLADAGLSDVRMTEQMLRQDRGAGITALIVTAALPGARRELEGDGETGALA